jgi:hypothetical protein
MRRILATLLAATLLMVLVVGSTAASNSKLVDVHALVANNDGVPVGWVDAHLTTPTVGDPSPGVIEFTPLADSGLPAWIAIAENAGFYRDENDNTPGVVAPSMQCVWDYPGTYACAEIQVFLLDGGSMASPDWFVTAPWADTDGSTQIWYQVVKGDIKVYVP